MPQLRYFILLLLICSLSVTGCERHPYSQGELIFKYNCANCHMDDGSGLAKLIPSLDKSRLTLSEPAKLVCLIRNGLPVNKLTGQEMPANTELNEVELTNLINYLGSKYALKPQTVQAPEVKKMLAGCQTD